MISLIQYQVSIVLAAFLCSCFGYFIICDYDKRGAIILGLTFAIIGGGASAIFLDASLSESAATSTIVSETIIDNYDGGKTFLNEYDLTIKLESGHIVKFSDPYEWKKFMVGSDYNYTQWSYTSYLSGNQTTYSYKYAGIK